MLPVALGFIDSKNIIINTNINNNNNYSNNNDNDEDNIPLLNIKV
jgi:hypothetical protein